MSKTWRDHARPIIARVLADNQGKPMKDIRKALRAAYPFGTYEYHPCKIWRDEIRVQLGLKKLRKAEETKRGLATAPCKGQKDLF